MTGIVKDELYPFYILHDGYPDVEADLSEDMLQQVREGMAGFEKAQTILHAAYERARADK